MYVYMYVCMYGNYCLSFTSPKYTITRMLIYISPPVHSQCFKLKLATAQAMISTSIYMYIYRCIYRCLTLQNTSSMETFWFHSSEKVPFCPD